ncbi:ABC transporter permease subunit [Lachnospiraceae bacterium ZAX-1]
MKSILKKEMNQYFKNMAGYIFLAIFLVITGYYFTINNLLAQSNDVKEYFNTMIFTLLFLIPILTMRLFAEERKSRTDQVLFTSPITILEIVLGKYLAACMVFLIGLMATLFYVITIGILGELELFTVIGCYVGIIFATGCFIAMGIFVSSITENQIVAAILTYAILMGFYVVNLLAGYVNNPMIAVILDWLAIFRRFFDFTMGIFNPSALFYYISLSVLFLFLTVCSVTRKRL